MSEEKKSILIIDDEASNLRILTHTLGADYTIYVAKEGQTGIDLAIRQCPDLILLDIIMPDMDGYEVLSALKANDSTKSIPVIFCTGLNEEEARTKGVQAAAFIAKPFSADVVKAKVKSVLY